MKGRYISSLNSSRSSRLHPWGFPNKHNERMPQGSQGSSASQVHHHAFEGLYGYICWVSGGSTSTSTVESCKIPGYQHPHLQWLQPPTLPPHLLSLVLPPLAQQPPSGLGWPTALIAGWAGSRLKIEKKILLLESKYCRFNWNISYCRGAAKSILERIPIIRNVP